jgi:nitroreductase
MFEAIRLRRSIRKYIDRPVEEEKLIEVINSARLAPSGSNTQPWHFIIVKSNSVKERLAKVSHNQEWMLTAPVFIVCVADIRSRINEDMEISLNENSPEPEVKQVIRDTSIAVEHLVLRAESLGLGTCWVAWFTQEDIRPILNIPTDKYVLSIITLGYPNESPRFRPRKKLEDIIHYESW